MDMKDVKTVIAEDVEITGSVKCASSIQLDGKLNGDLTCVGSAVLGATAHAKGNLAVESVTVHGQVTGNIVARDKIELKPTTRFNGDIKARRLTVEDGVTFIGKVEVNPSAPVPPRPEGAEPAPTTSAPAKPAETDSAASKPGLFGKK